MALPHIKNSQAGRNLMDPVHNNIFEVYFTLPEPLREYFAADEQLITEHVLKVSGLDALNKAPEAGAQKFMGTDRSYINPKLDSTRAEFSVDFSLNLRNGNDNYIYRLFKAWAKLGYDISTGERHVKKDYCANWLRIAMANRNGNIFRVVTFKDVMINGGLDGMSDLDYDSADAQTLTVKFVSDWWDDTDAATAL